MKINNKKTRTDGTSFQGQIDTSYERLLEKLGKPIMVDSDKVNVEWVIEKDGVIATIYDWKNHFYPKYTTEWHIGGFSQEAVDLVNSILE